MTMTEQVTETSTPDLSLSNPLGVYIKYPFFEDETYQQGLASLIAGGALDANLTTEEKEEVLRRTRVFYFNRVTGNALSVEEVRIYEHSQPQEQHKTEDRRVGGEVTATTASNETRTLTFAELQALIESGKVDQIPNNKIISESLNVAPPSQSTAPSRKKPWEVGAER